MSRPQAARQAHLGILPSQKLLLFSSPVGSVTLWLQSGFTDSLPALRLVKDLAFLTVCLLILSKREPL